MRNQRVQLGKRRSAVDALRRNSNTLFVIAGFAACSQPGSSVEQPHVSLAAVYFSVEDAVGDLGVVLRITTQQIGGISRFEAKSLRIERVRMYLTIAQFANTVGSSSSEFVQPAVAMYHEGRFTAELT